MTATPPLPRLLSKSDLALELGIKPSTAEKLMRRVPKLKIGRFVFVRAEDIEEWLREEAKT